MPPSRRSAVALIAWLASELVADAAAPADRASVAQLPDVDVGFGALAAVIAAIAAAHAATFVVLAGHEVLVAVPVGRAVAPAEPAVGRPILSGDVAAPASPVGAVAAASADAASVGAAAEAAFAGVVAEASSCCSVQGQRLGQSAQ